MAKFVLAGKTDCPVYAKAELLADRLQCCLPNFRIHKISILPDEWKQWLEATCKKNGWKHKDSPLVWRELVDQGGKGMLLGGFGEFLEHCQDYYNITSDMTTDEMMSIAAENLQAKMNLIEEEQERARLISPLHMLITSALSPICLFLIPNLLSAEVLPDASLINLHLLDLDGSEEELQQLERETQDLAFPTLHKVTVHGDTEQAFQRADVIILLDEWRSDYSNPEDEEEEEKRKIVKRISDRYREYGRLIDESASKEVRVIVATDLYVNLGCSLLLESAPSIGSGQIVAVATQLENEARATIARKLDVKTSDVTDIIVWGNISGSFYVDLQRAKVYNYDGAISGPPFFSQPVLRIIHDREWLETDFQDLVYSQRAALALKTSRTAAMSSANGILTILKAWNGLCGPDEVFSMGVLCSGHFDLPDGIVFSVPVTFKQGKWSVFPHVTIGGELDEKLQLFASEIQEEKELASEGLQKTEDTEDSSQK